MEAKFKVGDKVKGIHSGSGLGPDDLGKIVTITEVGKYGQDPGYRVKPAIGNTKSGYFNGFINEISFELAKEKLSYDYKFKVGDKVKIVKNGYGFASSGGIVTITELGEYGYSSKGPGYRVTPEVGNSIGGVFNGFNGELSFELFKEEKKEEEKSGTSISKFNVGDVVEVIINGRGMPPETIGSHFTITEIGTYVGIFTEIGYKVNPPAGNTLTGSHKGFIGESSFKLVNRGDGYKIPTPTKEIYPPAPTECFLPWEVKIAKEPDGKPIKAKKVIKPIIIKVKKI